MRDLLELSGLDARLALAGPQTGDYLLGAQRHEFLLHSDDGGLSGADAVVRDQLHARHLAGGDPLMQVANPGGLGGVSGGMLDVIDQRLHLRGGGAVWGEDGGGGQVPFLPVQIAPGPQHGQQAGDERARIAGLQGDEVAEAEDVVAREQGGRQGVLEDVEDGKGRIGGPPVLGGDLGEGDVGGFDAGFGMGRGEGEGEDAGAGGDVSHVRGGPDRDGRVQQVAQTVDEDGVLEVQAGGGEQVAVKGIGLAVEQVGLAVAGHGSRWTKVGGCVNRCDRKVCLIEFPTGETVVDIRVR